MKKHFFKHLSPLFILLLFVAACSKDKDSPEPTPQAKKVKYELSGNYSGKILLVTSTNSGNLQQFDNLTLPTTKELDYDKAVLAAGAGLQTSGINVGAPGQTVILKVYINGTLKDTKPITADANGLVNSALSFYTF